MQEMAWACGSWPERTGQLQARLASVAPVEGERQELGGRYVTPETQVIPDEYQCLICHHVMTDPVRVGDMNKDGKYQHCCNRCAQRSWTIRDVTPSDFLTRRPVGKLVRDTELRDEISKWVSEQETTFLQPWPDTTRELAKIMEGFLEQTERELADARARYLRSKREEYKSEMRSLDATRVRLESGLRAPAGALQYSQRTYSVEDLRAGAENYNPSVVVDLTPEGHNEASDWSELQVLLNRLWHEYRLQCVERESGTALSEAKFWMLLFNTVHPNGALDLCEANGWQRSERWKQAPLQGLRLSLLRDHMRWKKDRLRREIGSPEEIGKSDRLIGLLGAGLRGARAVRQCLVQGFSVDEVTQVAHGDESRRLPQDLHMDELLTILRQSYGSAGSNEKFYVLLVLSLVYSREQLQDDGHGLKDDFVPLFAALDQFVLCTQE